MAKAKNASTLSVHLLNDVADEIRRRSAAMGWSVSKYAAYLLQDWYARGAPPINSIDKSIRAESQKSARARPKA